MQDSTFTFNQNPNANKEWTYFNYNEPMEHLDVAEAKKMRTKLKVLDTGLQGVGMAASLLPQMPKYDTGKGQGLTGALDATSSLGKFASLGNTVGKATGAAFNNLAASKMTKGKKGAGASLVAGDALEGTFRGAGIGTQIGSKFGPAGAGIGALVGGGVGLLTGGISSLATLGKQKQNLGNAIKKTKAEDRMNFFNSIPTAAKGAKLNKKIAMFSSKKPTNSILPDSKVMNTNVKAGRVVKREHGGTLGCGCNKAKDGIDTDIFYKFDSEQMKTVQRFIGTDANGNYTEADKQAMKEKAENAGLSLVDYLKSNKQWV
jgi:hypothetical protein